MKEDDLTHFNHQGDVHMVNVGEKKKTLRQAKVVGYIGMEPETLLKINEGGHKKGDVLQVARIAGIMASKKTSELIPLCHPIMINHINIDFDCVSDTQLCCRVTCETYERTGIEMEALVACNVALMTVYDMCKSIDRGMVITGVQLLEKKGGKSGSFIVS